MCVQPCQLNSYQISIHCRITWAFSTLSESTNIRGHIFDLVLTRVSDNLFVSCEVEGLTSDHLAVTSSLQLHRSLRPQRSITFRKLKSIDLNIGSEKISSPCLSFPTQLTILTGFLSNTKLSLLMCLKNMLH
jgi:hypothetical protein